MSPHRNKIALTLCTILFSIASAAAVDLSKFPVTPAFELTADEKPEPVPLRWAGGWVLVRVKINDADAGWFKIATGWIYYAIDEIV